MAAASGHRLVANSIVRSAASRRAKRSSAAALTRSCSWANGSVPNVVASAGTPEWAVRALAPWPAQLAVERGMDADLPCRQDRAQGETCEPQEDGDSRPRHRFGNVAAMATWNRPAVAGQAIEPRLVDKRGYEKELERLQVEVVRLQDWIIHNSLRVVVVFEGRDTAGKGGTIKRITEKTNPRVVRTVALGTPTERERTQWYFQRYVAHLPAGGEMVLFDRSWYNRAGVERVMGFCTQEEYEEFMRTCPQFERELLRSGIILIKYWLSVSDEEQERRFRARLKDPAKQWKLSPMDLEARARWVDYAEAKDDMFAYTDTRESPWYVVEADDKRTLRLNLISHLLTLIPYEKVHQKKIELPARQSRAYVRPPQADQNYVPVRYKVN